jgi:hypothetical protein
MNPDSIVEYVQWLDSRYNRLINAIMGHRASKRGLALPGSIDGFDRELWSVLDAVYDPEE